MKIKIREADRLFSLYLRKKRKYICERCGRFYPEGNGLQASHYFGRAAESVRFDEDNVDVLCFTDHQFFTANPNEYREWKVKKLGPEELKKLTIRWNTYKKKDDSKVILVYKKLLEEL